MIQYGISGSRTWNASFMRLTPVALKESYPDDVEGIQ
jgi:hypothetical protein